eukprot:scaffold107398_cov14-Tisochrysis_lutea.AAC.1
MATAPMVMAGQGMCCGAVHRAASVVLTAWWGSLSCQCAIGVICDANIHTNPIQDAPMQCWPHLLPGLPWGLDKHGQSMGLTSCLVCLGVLANMDCRWASPPARLALAS